MTQLLNFMSRKRMKTDSFVKSAIKVSSKERKASMYPMYISTFPL